MADHAQTNVDSFRATGLVASDTYSFTLNGGRYSFVTGAGNYGAGNGITLQHLLPDGTTYQKVANHIADAVPPAIIELPPGRYQIAVAADVTAGQVGILKIPR